MISGPDIDFWLHDKLFMHAEITKAISDRAGTGQPYPLPLKHLGRAKEGSAAASERSIIRVANVSMLVT